MHFVLITPFKVRLWDIGQQRCIKTYNTHKSSVWTLFAEENFSYFISTDREGNCYHTDTISGDATLLYDNNSSDNEGMAPLLSVLPIRRKHGKSEENELRSSINRSSTGKIVQVYHAKTTNIVA